MPRGASLLDEVVGLGWRLFVDGRRNIDWTGIEGCGIPAFAIGGEGHSELDGVIAAWFDRYGCRAALVRPDHYVYCTVVDFGDLHEMVQGLRAKIGSGGFASNRLAASGTTSASIVAW
jgi:3-(3-hydroxy-phenyl)propionate hydroxylase